MNSFSKNQTIQKQDGAALIVALVVLLALTILAVAVMQSSTIQERMAGNYIDRTRVFQAAESALSAAEQRIDTWTSSPITGNGIVYAVGGPDVGSDTWWANTANSTAYSPSLTGISNNPRYVIEEYSFQCGSLVIPNENDCAVVYRVTARATGGRNTSIILQSIYARRF